MSRAIRRAILVAAWKVALAITFAPITGTDKAVLGCLIDFANSETGACWPAQSTIARAIGKDLRAVKRSIQNLIKTPYLKRTLRYRKASNTLYLKDAQQPPLAFAPPRDRGATSGARAATTSLSLIVETLSRRTQAAFFKAGYVPNLASQD